MLQNLTLILILGHKHLTLTQDHTLIFSYLSSFLLFLSLTCSQRHPHLFTSKNPMLQKLTLTLTLGHKPLTLTLIYRIHIHLRLTYPHNTFLLYYFLSTLQTQPFCHVSFSITQHVSIICQMVSAL